ncbi:PREDICTED: rho GTPase-activating protein REN1-like isoform X2 [Lupinus angustifolius]|nr:PREDICTED: rho GTPase-activating protein REN1-like isoform X2 [Lupinus angustifolius]
MLQFCELRITDMSNKSVEPQGNGNGGASLPSSNSDPQPGPPEHMRSHSAHDNSVIKSGALFISSKGIGWTSWKKRWFILTRSSLVFFRSDPNAVSQKGSEVNLTLGGIDLNNSGSVVVKADKKLLTVQFPDIRDGRAFTLKAETTEDLYEWKNALEDALAQAPSAGNLKGQNSFSRNDDIDSFDISMDQLKEVKDRREPMKSTVTGRPILLALEDADGTPTFLEKALRFIEDHGAKVEGILRQAADVEHVKHRVQEYEEGKVDFLEEEEDAHVIADCVKYVIRELPSSPVPASCCKALLEACRTGRANRVSAMRIAIWDTFPEPNRYLLQRILLMMQAVASHKAVNKMSSSAVAACMAPLLLRPLLAGDCEIENDFDVGGGDDSIQLLQAAAAANHAQAIVITLLEEYSSIFGEGSEYPGPEMFTDSEESGSESEEATDDDDYYDDDEEDESIQESDDEEDIVSQTDSETGDSMANDEYDDKDNGLSRSSSTSSKVSEDLEVDQILSSTSLEVSPPQCEDVKSCENVTSPIKTAYANESSMHIDIVGDLSTDQTTMHNSNCSSPSCMEKSIAMPNEPATRRCTIFGRTAARKNLSMECVNYPDEDEAEIERLEDLKTELQNQITEEVKENTKLQSDVEKRKKALQERHLALERDVARLQEQLQKEKSSRATLEAGLKFPQKPLSDLSSIDEKTKADLEELVLIEVDLANLEQKIDDLGVRLNLQLERNYGPILDCFIQPQQISNHERNLKNKPDTEVTATLQYERSTSKDTYFAGAGNLSERRAESKTKSLSNKHPPTSKKSGTRGEGANSTTSALTKLSSKLNFLKERRSSEGHESPKLEKVSELLLPLPSPKKSRGYEFHLPPPSPSKSRGYEFYLPLLSPKSSKSRGYEIHSPRGPGKEGESLQHPEKFRKSDSQPGHHPDRQNQHPPLYLRRGKSEGHHHS